MYFIMGGWGDGRVVTLDAHKMPDEQMWRRCEKNS